MSCPTCGHGMTGREPLEFEGRWLWHPKPPGTPLDEQPDYLPVAVFDKLQGHITKPAHVIRRVKAYPTHTFAMNALKVALEPTP